MSVILTWYIALASPSSALSQVDWKPIAPADLALKAPVVEKDADAEAIFWEVRVSDEILGGTFGSKMHTSRPQYVTYATTINNYVRLKIFNERGRESQSKIDIPFWGSWKIEDVSARTITPTGNIVELQKENVFERTIVNANGIKVKAKSFVLPNVEPGSIIEYRWKERRTGEVADHLHLPFQRDVPVQLVKYYIRPLIRSAYGMRAQTFNGLATPFAKEKDEYYSVTMSNVPAFHAEPFMPPESTIRPWMLVYYTPDENLESDKFWEIFGTKLYEIANERMQFNDEVKATALAVVGNAAGPEEKLQALFNFCRLKIKNTGDDASELTQEEKAKLKVNKSAADTLKRGAGTGTDIQMLFAALANAVGFDARVVHVGDRSEHFLDKSFPNPYFLRTLIIGVKLNDEWKFFNPASTYVPYGMLRWQEEFQQALVSDPEKPIWVNTPLSPASKSLVKRTAHLKLSDEGTLEGDVQIAYYGHAAVERKEAEDDSSSAQREETVRNTVKAYLSAAEISNIQVENVTDPLKPLIQSYHVRVPGYAQRTAKRFFLKPAFFESNLNPVFSASVRKYDVYFNYPWSEEDEVCIELPEGLTVEGATVPTAFGSGEISRYNSSVTADGKSIVYRRAFFFGEKNSIFYPIKKYEPLKAYFDKVHNADNRTVTLIPRAKQDN